MKKVPCTASIAAALMLAGCSSSATSGGVEKGPPLSKIVTNVKGQISGTTNGNFGVTGVTNVTCNPPTSWKPGNTFKCYAYGSSMNEIREYDATITPDQHGDWAWNASWSPTAAPTTTTPRASNPPTPVTAPPTTQPSPSADVTISSCAVDQTDSTIMDVAGKIVNHDTQPDDYVITVAFLQGSTRVGSAEDAETAISAAQTATWSTLGNITPINNGTVTCQLLSVSRTATNS